MSLLASLLYSAALALRPDAGLRLYNPHVLPVEATLTCAGAAQVLRIEPGAFADVADASRCTSIDGALPLLAIETRGEDTQRTVVDEAACGDAILIAPLFACESGTGVAAVPFTDGATYSWSVEGAAIIDGAGTPRVSLAFGQPGSVKLTCVITTTECSSTANAVIAVREPIAIAQLTLPESASTDEPVTITWTYGATSPTSQLLTGDALDEPVALPGAARSHTFTPKRTGSRTVELRAGYYAAMPAGTSGGKRRAGGRSAASASDCAIVSATRALEVKGCSTFVPRIHAPTLVDAGSTFEARVNVEEGEESQWTVENATLLSDAPGRATIRAGETGEVNIAVRVSRGACTRSSSTSLTIVPAAKPCPVAPVATLTYVSHGCDGAVVKASFTGTPPFRGTWSDGTTFNTSHPSLEHTFEKPGTYGVTGFRDATCIGVVSGAPRVDTLRGSVRLEVVDGACTTGKLVAKFGGTPPYTFKWTRLNEWVTTSEREIVRELGREDAGNWRIEGMMDAVCREKQATSNTIDIQLAPEAEVLPGPSCQYDDFSPAQIVVRFPYGRPPFSVKWSDGVVTSSNAASNYLYRSVPKPVEPIEEYTLVSATSFGCFAELGNRTAKASYRPTPRIDTKSIDPLLCPGDTATATLKTLPAPEATIVWTVPGGEILSGQGTPTITYRGTSVTDSLIKAEAVYPDGACSTFDHVMVRFHGISAPTDYKVTPSTIKRGGSAVVSFRIDRNVNGFSIGTDPSSRQDDLGLTTCKDDFCQATFTDTTGPGTVELELQYFGDCMPHYESLSTTLTIQE